MSRQDMVKLIHVESERLKQYVNTLPPDALERPSPCEGWTVGDVVAHLVWFAETYGGMMERGLRGDTSAPEGFPTPGTLSGPAVGALYGQGAVDRRQELGDTLIPVFVQTCDQLNVMLRGIGPEDWDKPCYHTRGLRSVQRFLTTIIQEFAVHEWDIRSSLEPLPTLSVASLPVLMQKLTNPRYRPLRVPFPSSTRASGPIRYRFDSTDRNADRRDIVVEGEKARMEPPGEALANLYVRGDTGTFVLLMYGRFCLDSAIATGSFKAEGNLELVPDFDRWLKGH